MAGLVAYSSSDEEDEVSHQVSPVPASKPLEAADADSKIVPAPDTADDQRLETRLQTATQLPSAPNQGALFGPSLPAQDVAADSYAYPELEYDDVDTAQLRSTSPYTTSRNLLRDLTLPQVPNLDIPPSPPGSPPPEMAQKVEQFLELKRTKAVHFNQRLAGSVAAANPSLPDRLLSFVGLGDPKSQYETGIPRDLLGWHPTDFPPGAYRKALREGQEKVRKEKEKERASGTRTAVEFAPSIGK